MIGQSRNGGFYPIKRFSAGSLFLSICEHRGSTDRGSIPVFMLYHELETSRLRTRPEDYFPHFQPQSKPSMNFHRPDSLRSYEYHNA
ncbi:hypothetical protein M413DRAFT_442005 [Hebeloma cylindrosporum]|uniref:Uncharacterized protein n=1 Tax=Hebeloma cylindrosporum TaxID=76867 RepID=A0A0C2YWF0_HEBCY|nr:hypothetical protein M413DRAFT_442005 [Hebeloma cylindrosporum h7]